MTDGMTRLGVLAPIVTAIPAVSAEWERTATIEQLALVAETADRLGYHHISCSEHVGVPASEAARRGSRYWDPLATFGYLAARTQRIRFTTLVLVLGYHHPLAIAKRYGTLDVISGGRLVLGVGVGTLKEEFDLLGAPFDDRGARADDAMRAVRASMSRVEPEYHGPYYNFSGLVVDPCAQQSRVPIWVGGRTARSLRRAVELGDGWCPFALPIETAAEWLRRRERPAGFEVVLRTEPLVDPVGRPEEARDAIRAAVEAGATIVVPRIVHHSLAHYLEQLAAATELGPAV